MPSPFPGMDPYLELYDWGDFHISLIVEIKRQLAPQIRPKYAAVAQQRVYLEHFDEKRTVFIPDVHLTDQPTRGQPPLPVSSGGAVTIEPETYVVPLPIEHKETFLVIRDEDGHEVVTVIEILSPTNKRRNADGYREYDKKREEVLRSSANLVEIDLLRGGDRPKTIPGIRAATDYCAMIHREPRRPAVDVYQWTLRQSLPTIPVPLSGNDPDVALDLAAAFDAVWNYSNFANRLDYTRPLRPPLRTDDEPWLLELLNKHRAHTTS